MSTEIIVSSTINKLTSPVKELFAHECDDDLYSNYKAESQDLVNYYFYMHHLTKLECLRKSKDEYTKFGAQFRFNLRNDTLPLIHYEAFNEICEELLFRISGCTDNNKLKSKNIHWYLPKNLKEDLGPFYGFQWRHFGAEYSNMHMNYDGDGVDQLAKLIKMIKENPNDRRLILCSWNSKDLPNMVTEPSECLAQFYVSNGELSCQLHQSSGNMEKEVPYSIARFSLLTYMIAHVTNLKPGDYIHTMGESIILTSQLPVVLEMLNSPMPAFPKLRITANVEAIEDFKLSHFSLSRNFSNDGKCKIFPLCLEAQTESKKLDEYQYLNQVQHILKHGIVRKDRTGTGTKSVFGTQARYSLRDGTFPLLTTKKVFWRGICEELIWFIAGSTDANVLKAKNVHIWDGNSSREYLASIGLNYPEEGDLGPVYGFQWRHFGAKYTHKDDDYSGQGVDQLANLITKINETPDAKNMVLCSWNVSDLHKMALPPCHCFMQFYVFNGELSCALYQRSGDMGLGVPFNIASYSLLTHMLAHVTGLKPGEFIHTIGDAHVYLNHIEQLQEQVKREPRPFPKLHIKSKVEKIEDFKFSDFELVGYNPYPPIKMEMSV